MLETSTCIMAPTEHSVSLRSSLAVCSYQSVEMWRGSGTTKVQDNHCKADVASKIGVWIRKIRLKGSTDSTMLPTTDNMSHIFHDTLQQQQSSFSNRLSSANIKKALTDDQQWTYTCTFCKNVQYTLPPLLYISLNLHFTLMFFVCLLLGCYF